ncbi:hypothetical protein C922_03478 [Plasmodium inui San Antonio 1]|uniref:Uncharacterized protein n=1 Tax=Plasmodium inui San Antonio 1 TaxID=1237626 RepID=W7A3Y8_9APIC|nr:hypothetical protein C922_03478 [Plasmodium inui San Antonio 1]EUD66008.1 hypothetical protein C922_03478 [Plasmodium inui San Antonio 1]
MKIQYHLLLFTFLLSEDVLCRKSIYEDIKDGSAEVKQGGSAGSNYLTHDGKKALWPGGGGNDEKGEENRSSNQQGGLLSSVLGSVKRMFLFNDKGIENNVQGISDKVAEMKDGMITNPSSIIKHASELKDELKKNTAYWANVVKTTVSEELHQIDKFSKDQLDKLRKDPEESFFFTKLFRGDNGAADTSSSSHKDKRTENGQGAVGSKGPSRHDDAEVEKEEKAKSFWDLLHIGGGNASPASEGKEPSTGFLRMFKGDTSKPSNVAERKDSFSWFSTHSSENGDASGKDSSKASTAEGETGKEVKKMSFLSHFTSEAEDAGKSPKGSDTEKNQGFTFNLFKRKDSNEESPSRTHSEKDHQRSDSHPNGRGSLFQWFSPPTEGTNNNDHSPQKEYSGGVTQDSFKGSQHDEVKEEKEEKKTFSIFNMWKETHKEKEGKHEDEVETGVRSNTSEVTNGESREESTKESFFSFNPFGGFKSDGESSHGGVAAPGETTSAEGMAQSELSKRNSHLVDLMKNIYDGKSSETGERAEKILSFMNTKHEHDASTNCHPLVSFKACLNTCFNVPPAVEGGGSNDGDNHNNVKDMKKKNLSVGDYRKLEKCILKCRNTNFSEGAPGCATKDGSVIASDKASYEEKLKTLERGNFNLGENSSVFSDLTLRDKYTDGKQSQSVNTAKGQMASGNSTWVMGSSGKHLTSSHTKVQSGSPNFPTLSEKDLGTHLYGMNSSKSSMGGDKKEPTDGTKNMSADNSFSFFKAFAPKTGSTSDGMKTLGAANPLDESHNGKKRAATEGAAEKSTAERGVHGEGPESVKHPIGDGNGDGDEDDDEYLHDFSYISKGFFMLLLLATFFVYLSAFTNIITQFYVSFKEKVCLYIKGQYRSRFDQTHGESAEAFLPKGRQLSHGNAVQGSYDNLYHAFHENVCHVA